MTKTDMRIEDNVESFNKNKYIFHLKNVMMKASV